METDPLWGAAEEWAAGVVVDKAADAALDKVVDKAAAEWVADRVPGENASARNAESPSSTLKESPAAK